MTLKDVQKQLLFVAKELSDLESSVDKDLLDKDRQFNIPVFFTQFFYFPRPSPQFPNVKENFSKQEKTIVNGAEDCFITKISYSYFSVSPTNPNPVGLNLEALFRERLVAPEALNFEFRWNFRIASTQSRYLSQANSVSLLSRRSLGFLDVGLPLSLAKPLHFSAGDAVAIEAEPLNTLGMGLYGIAVCFTLHGFRNGEMA